MKRLIIALFALSIFCTGVSFAKKDMKKVIKVNVSVDKSTFPKWMWFYGTGFSIGDDEDSGTGSPGSSTSKSGQPAGEKYSFGFRTRSDLKIGRFNSGKGDIDCGSATLNQDSDVRLYLKGGKCLNEVTPMKK